MPQDPMSTLKAIAQEAIGRAATAAADELIGVVEERTEAFLGGVKEARRRVKRPAARRRTEPLPEVIDVEAEVVPEGKKRSTRKR